MPSNGAGLLMAPNINLLWPRPGGLTMKPSLFAHPFASYCQKVLIALYENDTDFTYRRIGPEDPAAMSELESLWPLKKFPVLRDAGRTYVESSVIIEYLGM